MRLLRIGFAGLLACCMAVSGPPAEAQEKLPAAESLDDKAWQMLVDALAEAKTASPPVQAWVKLEFAKQLDQDGKKSEEKQLMHQAYLATLQGPTPEYNTIGWIQSDILRAMMKNTGPEPVEELLPQMGEEERALAFDMLVTRYTAEKNWEKAMDAVRRAPANNWFPFFPAVELMKALPAQEAGKRREIYDRIYSIYKKDGNTAGTLQQIIELFWRELPREQVIEMIPVLLKNAMRVGFKPGKRPVNYYPDLKAKLMPIWKELDPAGAEKWEREEPQTLEEAQKPSSFQAYADSINRQKILGDTHPAPPNPAPYKKPPGSPKPRAVAGCMEDEPWCQQNRVEHALAAVEEHLKKKEMEQAKEGISRGYWIALSQWKLDTDSQDPNQVIKTYWPSTANWEAFSVMASRISPEYALARVKEIPDAEIRLLTRTMLARTWLDHKPVFPACPALHSNYHNEGACIGYYQFMPFELFSWANQWE
jgi:hypothetical protein